MPNKVRYILDPNGWENLDPPEKLLSPRYNWGDCNNHWFLMACMFDVIGIQYTLIYVASRTKVLDDGYLVPLFSHIVIGVIDKNGEVIPIETINPYPLGELAPHQAIAVYHPDSKKMLLKLSPESAKLVGWTEKYLSVSKKEFRVIEG